MSTQYAAPGKVNEAAALSLVCYVLHQPRKFMKRSDRQLSRVRYQLIVGTKMSLYVNMSIDQGYIYISFYLLMDFILFIKVTFPA